MWTLRNDLDDSLKTHKAATGEEFIRVREETRQRIDEAALRTTTDLSRTLQNTITTIEDMVNNNLVSQM